MSVVTPTSPTESQLLAPTSYASSATPGTRIDLDLRGKWGANLTIKIGRNAASALTRAAEMQIRKVLNSVASPNQNYDCISSIAAVNATTVSSGGASGAATMVLASGTGFASGQLCLAQLAAARAEWFTIDDLATATITNSRGGGFTVTHNASDVVTNGADVFNVWLPGNTQYEITPVNNSGQTVVMAIDISEDRSDTIT